MPQEESEKIIIIYLLAEHFKFNNKCNLQILVPPAVLVKCHNHIRGKRLLPVFENGFIRHL